MLIKIALSDQYYLLDGLVYSAANTTADNPLVQLASLAAGDWERAQFAKKYNLVLPGTPGQVIGTTTANGVPKYTVQFDGISDTVSIAGKFLTQV